MRLDLAHRPEAPLVDVGVRRGLQRPQRILAVLFGQVEIDRHRFPNHDAVVFKHRHVPVGIAFEILGRLGFGRRNRKMLVFDAELFESPQGPGAARS